MKVLMEFVLNTALPAGIANGVAGLTPVFFPTNGNRFRLLLGAAIAFCLGYVVLPQWAELTPQRHWQWLPYLCCLSVVTALAAQTVARQTLVCTLLFAALALVSAWCLVPRWPDLAPPRPISVGLLAGYLFGLTLLLDRLPQRLVGLLFCILLAVLSLVLAVVLGVAVSLKFGQLALVIASAIGGVCVFCTTSDGAAPRALIPFFAVVCGGLGYVGAIEPSHPLFGLLLIPAAPIALWACAVGPFSRLAGWKAGLAQIGLVTLPLVGATVWVLMAEGS